MFTTQISQDYFISYMALNIEIYAKMNKNRLDFVFLLSSIPSLLTIIEITTDF